MSGKMIAVSPKRQLDEALGIMRHQNAKHRGKWHCGDRVYDEADERHIGVIEGITNSATVKVRWEETSWYSYIPLRCLRRAP